MTARGTTLLARWLEKTGTTQDALADRLGVTQPYVSRLVGGARSPGRSVSLAIEKVTGGVVPAESWDDEPERRGLRPSHA